MIHVTRGAATACLQIATIARQDPDDARDLFESMLAEWQRLDEELIHPIETPSHAESCE